MMSVTARGVARFMRPLLAKIGIPIDEDGTLPGGIRYGGLFDMPPRPMLKKSDEPWCRNCRREAQVHSAEFGWQCWGHFGHE